MVKNIEDPRVVPDVNKGNKYDNVPEKKEADLWRDYTLNVFYSIVPPSGCKTSDVVEAGIYANRNNKDLPPEKISSAMSKHLSKLGRDEVILAKRANKSRKYGNIYQRI